MDKIPGLHPYIAVAQLMFFWGALRAVRSVIHSPSPTMHMVLLSSELRVFEDEQRGLVNESKAA